MGVGARTVGEAIRLQREDPELFIQVRAGRTALDAAVTQFAAPPADAALAARRRAFRARLNALMRKAAGDPVLIQRLEERVEPGE